MYNTSKKFTTRKIVSSKSASSVPEKLRMPMKFQRHVMTLRAKMLSGLKMSAQISLFVFLLTLYIIRRGVIWFTHTKLWIKATRGKYISQGEFLSSLIKKIDGTKPGTISRTNLIELSLRNMGMKKTRTLVTMGGMAIGIAFIVFLVSVGYGLQNLVITRVVRLDELRQADVLPGLSDDLSLNENVIGSLTSLQHVKSALPVIAVVGKLTYKQSVSDVAVYGVTTDYLKYSAVQPIRGKLFESNDTSLSVQKSQNPQKEVTEIAQSDAKVTGKKNSEKISVLGTSTQSSTGSLPLVDIASQSGETKSEVKVISVASNMKELVVNEATLQLLGIDINDAIGKKITTTFVVVADLIPGSVEKVESSPDEYTIVGVISDNSTPLMYVPFINLRAMGITNFSQIKINVDANENLLDVRKHIESSGYGTVSVADTVVQINNLFANVRLLLSILGMVALSVASLGMFNTLTVSLLERTREVGLMKAMGMKSYEVRDLFLTESMIMGFFGGLIGLLFGMLIGKGVSIILSVFSVAKGVGFVDISFVPPVFVVAVVILSVLVGVFTGLYPAKRATKISALNALRYE